MQLLADVSAVSDFDFVPVMGALIGNVALSSIAAALIVFFIQQFFPKLLDYRWARRLEHAKAELEKEADRLFKVHTKEFEVLPDIWAKANLAYGAVQLAVRPTTKDDVAFLSHDELLEVMQTREFEPKALKRVQEAHNKPDQFDKEMQIINFSKAELSFNGFSNEYFLQELFIPDDVAQLLSEMRLSMKSILSRRYLVDPNSRGSPKDIQQVFDDVEALPLKFDRLKGAMRRRLKVDRA